MPVIGSGNCRQYISVSHVFSLYLQTRTDIDVVHQYLLQTIAVVNFGRLISLYQTWESRDPGVTTSFMVSGGIVCICTIFVAMKTC